MAIQIIDGFQVNTASPIDNRIVASGSSARNAIAYKYEGLRVFDTSDSVPYVWLNGAWVSENASGIVASSTTANYIPRLTGSNVVTNSIIYQSGSNIGVNTISPSATFSVNGSLSATTLIGDGSQVTNINASNIASGTLGLNRFPNGSTGWILTGSGAGPTYSNPAQITVGTASVAVNVDIQATTASSNHYLTFLAGGSWLGLGGNSNIRTNISANNITYNPGTNTLNTGIVSASGFITTTSRFNTNNGSLPSSVNSRLIAASFSSATSPNTSHLEIFNARFSAGSDWLSSGQRIQARVDDQYMGYIQFNGVNEAGVSFGTGYMGMTYSSNSMERMRLDGTGRIFMGTTQSLSSGCVLHIKSNSNLYDGVIHSPYSNTQSIFEFLNTSGVSRGKIVGAGSSAVSYATSSDKRLKDDIQEMPSMYETIKSLKPSKFKWKEDKTEDFGFIAQEVFKVLPNLRGELSNVDCDVNNPDFDVENPIKKDGSEHYYALDYGKLTPYLTKALQETMEKLEDLTNKIKSANSLEELKNSL